MQLRSEACGNCGKRIDLLLVVLISLLRGNLAGELILHLTSVEVVLQLLLLRLTNAQTRSAVPKASTAHMWQIPPATLPKSSASPPSRAPRGVRALPRSPRPAERSAPQAITEPRRVAQSDRSGTQTADRPQWA